MGRPARARRRPARPRTPAEAGEWFRPQPLIGQAGEGVVSAVWFRAPERASRIASWARSRRHGEEWLWVLSDGRKASVRVCVGFRVRARSMGQDPLQERPGGLGNLTDGRAPFPVSGSAARAVRACGRLRALGAEGSGGNQPAAAAGGWDRWARGAAAMQPLRPPNPSMHRVFPRGRPHRRRRGGGAVEALEGDL